MSNLNEQINSAFKILNDLFKILNDFKPNDFGGFGCTKSLANGFEISIQCGMHNYCTPRENLNSPSEYSTFEVAVFNADEDWVTPDFFEDCGNDQVKGWTTMEEILVAIECIQQQK